MVRLYCCLLSGCSQLTTPEVTEDEDVQFFFIAPLLCTLVPIESEYVAEICINFGIFAGLIPSLM